MDKTSIRKQLVEQRLSLQGRLQRAEQLQRVMRIWLVGRPDTVIGAYWPIKGEFDPLPALYRWQEDGALGGYQSPILEDIKPKTAVDSAQAASNFVASITQSALNQVSGTPQSPRKIGLPVVDKVHKTLTFYAWYPGCPMEEDAYQIPKPKDTEVVVPTLLFVPCVGFGPGGYRLGYGGGFYDRTLASLQPKPVTVGLAYAHAYLPSFEPEPHDVPLAAILTEDGQAYP
jgi:5-formyltetrahydrofolate cyclo-ligase